MKKIGVIVYGCGVMGQKIAHSLHIKKSFEVMGAVDIAEDLAGRDLGEFFPKKEKTGIAIQKDAQQVLSETKAQAAVIATTSYLKDVTPQIEMCIEAGLDVISTCEELSFPSVSEAKKAGGLDRQAKDKNVTVTGTGINPGFLMDSLPLMLTAPCLEVRSIRVLRMMDSSKRRTPFQFKVGTGLTQEEFYRKMEEEEITGHVGLKESMYMIAEGLGWNLDEAVEAPPVPVVDEEVVHTGLGMVEPGKVVGLTSTAYGKMGGKEVITLVFNANAAVDEEFDEIIIKGVPDIHQKILGGVHGDVGTVAVTVNAIPKVIQASPGLRTMKDLPPCARVP
ncbi:MAG: dihydrodipicolinate reductase [Candidatus Aminicenantes bacterium]|nr:dihydrodipicolinate reductase [Candidatus Aminicenantes bacterium]